MAESKSNRKAIKILFVIIPIALIALLALVYFAVFKSITVVQDSSWKTVLPKYYYLHLQGQLVKKGYRVSVKTIDSDVLDESNLQNVFQKLDTRGIVVASPVITAAVTTLQLDLEDMLKNVVVVGLGFSNSSGLFDAVLVSNTTTGWEEAAKNAVSTTSKNAVIYDGDAVSEAKTIYNALGSTGILINKDEFGKLFSSEIARQLEESKVETVFCPHVSSMSDIVLSSTSQKWVVDYRYSGVVPKDQLLGVVCPDLFASLENFYNPSILDFESETNYLIYEYREAHRSIF